MASPVFQPNATRRWRLLFRGPLEPGKAECKRLAGCLVYEMLTGLPLFPGKTDVDQLNLVAKGMGSLLPKHIEALRRQVLQLSMSERRSLSDGPLLQQQLQGLDVPTCTFIKVSQRHHRQCLQAPSGCALGTCAKP